jgi:hypothetical protein
LSNLELNKQHHIRQIFLTKCQIWNYSTVNYRICTPTTDEEMYMQDEQDAGGHGQDAGGHEDATGT